MLIDNNILFAQDGTLKITDFGIVRATEFSAMTRTGSVIGTPHYMSPEQAKGERADIRSDVYALGIVLYEMLVGELPFVADTPLAVLEKHSKAFDNLETVLNDAGLKLSDVVRLNYYTTDADSFMGAAEVAGICMGKAGCRPASTLLGVARLAFPELLIEIEATAVV